MRRIVDDLMMLAKVGDPDTPLVTGPVDLGAGRTAKALAVGDYHGCAVLDSGDVRCWGYGNEGQVGSWRGSKRTSSTSSA